MTVRSTLAPASETGASFLYYYFSVYVILSKNSFCFAPHTNPRMRDFVGKRMQRYGFFPKHQNFSGLFSINSENFLFFVQNRTASDAVYINIIYKEHTDDNENSMQKRNDRNQQKHDRRSENNGKSTIKNDSCRLKGNKNSQKKSPQRDKHQFN